MKGKLQCTIFIAIFTLTTSAQIANWTWVKSSTGANNMGSQYVAADANGNSYLTGWFSSASITFGSNSLSNNDVTGSTSDIFLSKYDGSGTLLWSKIIGGNKTEQVNSITTDKTGNVYITGRYGSSSLVIGTTTLTNASSSGSSDIFIAKYDPTGNVLWAKSIGGTSGDEAFGIDCDLNKNVYISGSFSSFQIQFGTTPTLTNTSSNGATDIFIAKYDEFGNSLWAKSATGNGWDDAKSVSVDTLGNPYITGIFRSSSFSFGTVILTNQYTSFTDIFTAKYNTNGSLLWAKSCGSDMEDVGNSITTDLNGNAYVTGFFSSALISFGSNTVTNINPNSNTTDVLLLKYDASGNEIWAKRGGGNNTDKGFGVTTDANGFIYMTGWVSAPSATFGTTSFNTIGGFTFFLVKYDASGSIIGVKSPTGNSSCEAYGVWVDGNGSIYLSGNYNGTNVTFGTISLTHSSLLYDDAFIAKIGGGAISISEIDINQQINVYPNPSKSQFVIEFINNTYLDNKIELFDLLGNLLFEQKATSNLTEIKLPHEIDKGVYVLRIIDSINLNIYSKKIIIQ